MEYAELNRPRKASEYYQLQCESGEVWGCLIYGQTLLTGARGVKRDRKNRCPRPRVMKQPEIIEPNFGA